jgi:hypothetical protein
VFNFRRVDLLMRQWDLKQGHLEAALFKYRQTGQRPLANARGCMGGPKVNSQLGVWPLHDPCWVCSALPNRSIQHSTLMTWSAPALLTVPVMLVSLSGGRD